MGSFRIWLGVAIVFGLLCAAVFTWLADRESAKLWRRFLLSFVGYTLLGLFIAGCLAVVFAD